MFNVQGNGPRGSGPAQPPGGPAGSQPSPGSSPAARSATPSRLTLPPPLEALQGLPGAQRRGPDGRPLRAHELTPAVDLGRIDPARREAIAREGAAWVSAAEPEEDRLAAMERVMQCVRHPSEHTSLMLTGLNLRSVPPGLDALSGLTEIGLTNNQLSELSPGDWPRLQRLQLGCNRFTRAPDLSGYPVLVEVGLNDNRLEAAPDARMLPSGLQEIDLQNNLITELPDLRQLSQLRTLNLAENRLQLMPDTSVLPQQIDSLNLAHNRIAHLPPEAFWRSRQAPVYINLTANPLSEDSIAFLGNEARNSVVHFESHPSARRNRLSDRVDTWLAAVPAISDARRQSLRDEWARFSLQEGADLFSELLSKMTLTAEFLNHGADARRDFRQRVADVLQTLTQDAALRQDCFDLAWEGLATCGDRVAWAFSKIELKAIAHGLQDDPKALFELARGEFRLEAVQQVAQEWLDAFERAGERVDEIEYMLALPLLLAKDLALPGQPRHMLYPGCARISEAQLAQAKQHVRDAEDADGGEALIHSVASRPYWRASLGQADPLCELKIRQLDEERDRQSEALYEAPGALTSAEYDQRYKAIQTRHTLATQQVYMEFTRAAIDAGFTFEAPAPVDAIVEVRHGNAVALPASEISASAQQAWQPLPEIARVPARPGFAGVTAHVNEIAARLVILCQQARYAEVRDLAALLLEPSLTGRLAQIWNSRNDVMATQHMCTNRVNVEYMNLLNALLQQHLLDAHEVFRRLAAPDSADLATDARSPYLHRVASRVASDAKSLTGLELEGAATDLLDAIATAREQTGERDARSSMRQDLLARIRPQAGAADATGNRHDFYSQLFGLHSSRRPLHASLAAVRHLTETGLMPEAGEFRAAGLDKESEKALAKAVKKAGAEHFSIEQPSNDMADIARRLSVLDVYAREANEEPDLENTRAPVDRARERSASGLRDAAHANHTAPGTRSERSRAGDLAPQLFLGMLFPSSATASSASAASSRAPEERTGWASQAPHAWQQPPANEAAAGMAAQAHARISMAEMWRVRGLGEQTPSVSPAVSRNLPDETSAPRQERDQGQRRALLE